MSKSEKSQIKEVSEFQQLPLTIKKEAISSVPSNDLLKINTIFKKLSFLHGILTKSSKQYENAANIILKWGQSFDYSLLKQSQKTLQVMKDYLLKGLERIIDEDKQSGEEENIENEFIQNWQSFMKINFQQKQIQEFQKLPQKSSPSSAITTHIMERTWDQLQMIKEKYLDESQQKNEKIAKLEKDLINAHNKYEELLQDFEEEKKTILQSEKDKKLYENLQDLQIEMNNFRNIISEQNKEKKALEVRVGELLAEIDSIQSDTQHNQQECRRMKIKVQSLKLLIQEQLTQIKRLKSERNTQKEEEYRKILDQFKQNSYELIDCRCKASSVIQQIGNVLQKNYPVYFSPNSQVKFTYTK